MCIKTGIERAVACTLSDLDLGRNASLRAATAAYDLDHTMASIILWPQADK